MNLEKDKKLYTFFRKNDNLPRSVASLSNKEIGNIYWMSTVQAYLLPLFSGMDAERRVLSSRHLLRERRPLGTAL